MGTGKPHYFFHVREGSELSRDEEGQDLPNVEAARHEAVAANCEILGEKLLHGGSLNHRTIEIAERPAMSWMSSIPTMCFLRAASSALTLMTLPSRRL